MPTHKSEDSGYFYRERTAHRGFQDSFNFLFLKHSVLCDFGVHYIANLLNCTCFVYFSVCIL